MWFTSSLELILYVNKSQSTSLPTLKAPSDSKQSTTNYGIHFQVSLAVVQSKFNTNCFLLNKCACAPRLTLLVPARNATLVAADTKHKLAVAIVTRNNTDILRLFGLFATVKLLITKRSRPWPCWSFSYSAHWLWQAGLKSPRKMMSWFWRKLTSRMRWKLTQIFLLSFVSSQYAKDACCSWRFLLFKNCIHVLQFESSLDHWELARQPVWTWTGSQLASWIWFMLSQIHVGMRGDIMLVGSLVSCVLPN